MNEMNDVLTVRPFKRVLCWISSFILIVLGLGPSIMLCFQQKIIWPVFVGAYFVFMACALWAKSKQRLEIRPDGLLLGYLHKPKFWSWSDIAEFVPGDGIDRDRVRLVPVDETSSRVNLGLFSLSVKRQHFLPDSFGIPVREMIDKLKRQQQEYVQQRAAD